MPYLLCLANATWTSGRLIATRKRATEIESESKKNEQRPKFVATNKALEESRDSGGVLPNSRDIYVLVARLRGHEHKYHHSEDLRGEKT